MKPNTESDPAEKSPIDEFVAGLQQRFGDRAIQVAQSQVDEAGPEARSIWLNILTALQAGPARP